MRKRVVTAATSALRDAEMSYAAVQTLYLGTVMSPPTYGLDVIKDLGLTGIPVVQVSNASATGGAAFFEAVHAVAGGRADLAMTIGFDDPKSLGVDFNRAKADAPGGGISPMAFFSMWAVRRMHEQGTQIETLARIAAKNWNNAAATLTPSVKRRQR